MSLGKIDEQPYAASDVDHHHQQQEVKGVTGAKRKLGRDSRSNTESSIHSFPTVYV